jgi:hypothetical protein
MQECREKRKINKATMFIPVWITSRLATEVKGKYIIVEALQL